MSNTNIPKYNLPRFRRVPSQHSTDSSFLNPNETAINTTRTVLSSSTMMSTPSNDIRRVQQRQNQPKVVESAHDIKRKPISTKPMNNLNVKKKLLNLLQSLKRKYPLSSPTLHFDKFTGPKDTKGDFVLRKPLNMSKYDYSMYTSYERPAHSLIIHDIDERETPLPPPVRESQIKAWELAEKVAANYIFESSSEDEDIANDDDIDPIYSDTSLEEIAAAKHNSTIEAIPGYTKGELLVILKQFESSQRSNIPTLKDETEKVLWRYQQQHNASQEKAFSTYQTMTGRRKVQLAQKRELLHKIFGYSNNINHQHLTNNTSHSSVDNVLSVQKAFHEDKEELASLMHEDKVFAETLDDIRGNLTALRQSNVGVNVKRKAKRNEIDLDDFDLEKFHDITHDKLSYLYDSYLGDDAQEDFSSEMDQELQSFTLAYLKKCIREEIDDTD